MKKVNIDEIYQDYISKAPEFDIEDFMLCFELEYGEFLQEDYDALKIKFNEYINNRNLKKASEAEAAKARKSKLKRHNCKYFIEICSDCSDDDIPLEKRSVERVIKVPKSLFRHLYKLMLSGYFIDIREDNKSKAKNWTKSRFIEDRKNKTKTLIFESYTIVQAAIKDRKCDLNHYLKNTNILRHICEHELKFIKGLFN